MLCSIAVHATASSALTAAAAAPAPASQPLQRGFEKPGGAILNIIVEINQYYNQSVKCKIDIHIKH